MRLQRALELLVTFPLLCLALTEDSKISYSEEYDECIGYRTVSDREAEAYLLRAHEPVWNDDFAQDHSDHFGSGLYLTAEPQAPPDDRVMLEDVPLPALNEDPDDDDDDDDDDLWMDRLTHPKPPKVCIVFANKVKTESTRKLRIPIQFKPFVFTDELWETEDNLFNANVYINQMSGDADDMMPKYIRIIKNKNDKYKIVLPPGLMNHNDGGLSLRVHCRLSVNALKRSLEKDDLPTPDYASPLWKANIEGSFDKFYDQAEYE